VDSFVDILLKTASISHMKHPEKKEPEKWMSLLVESQKKLLDEFTVAGAVGIGKRIELKEDVTKVLSSLKNAKKFDMEGVVALSPPQLCQLIDFLGRQGFRIYGDLILVEQQVSVFAKISTLLSPSSEGGGEPKLEVAFYAHIDPVIKMGILYLIFQVDPEFKVSAHPFTRPTAI
jgi:hypothetical protein